MLTYTIFFIVVLIFLFILSLTLKAINRGMEAKNNIKREIKKKSTKQKRYGL